MIAHQMKVMGRGPISVDEIGETGGLEGSEDGSGCTGGPWHDVWSVGRGGRDGDSVRRTGSGDGLNAQALAIGSGGKGSGSSSSSSSGWIAEGLSRGRSGCAGDMRG